MPVSFARRTVCLATKFHSPFAAAVTVSLLVALTGAMTIPRQLSEMDARVSKIQSETPGAHAVQMNSGLRRFIVLDRVFPPLAMLGAAWLTALIAAERLVLSARATLVLRTALIFGLVPTVGQKICEGLAVWMVAPGSVTSIGEIIDLPGRFSSGLVPGSGESVAALNERVNVFNVWILLVWVRILMTFDGNRLRPWQVGLPVGIIALSSIVVWHLRPTVLKLVLG